jgi:glycosyltransferase involved in cell wall biosynthesis
MSQSDRTSVTFVLPSLAGGGAERVVLTLARHLDRARFAPALIVLHGTGPLREAIAPDIPVTDLGTPRLRHAWRRLGQALERVPGGVVIPTISHVNLAVLALRRHLPTGTRIIARESNTPSANLATTAWPGLMRWLYRRYFPAADAVLCPSQMVANEFSQDFGVKAERLVVLPHPVASDTIREAATPPLRKAGDGLRFVAAGRMARQKGFDRLIDLFADLPEDSHLTILGDGEQKEALQAQAARLGLMDRIDFPGFVANPWSCYAGADAFLLPSRWEGMPNAALEALAVGTPVIAWRGAGGVGEIGAAADALVLADGAPGFAEAMLQVPRHDGLTVRTSLLPARFTLPAVMHNFEALIDAVRSGRP